MQPLLDFLNRLAEARISYSLAHVRPETVMVLVAVPGERWEVEFFADGRTEVEVFTGSDGVHDGAGRLEALFERFGERPATAGRTL